MLLVEAIDVYYGGIQALRGVNLEVGQGELVALVGANGAGKTTTLRSVSGLVRPRRGRIVFDGQPIDRAAPQDIVRMGISQLPEGRGIFFGLSVFENLRMGAYVHRHDRTGNTAEIERVLEYFPRLRERQQQLAGSLSGGEQQMLALARALVSRPRLLMIDELSLGLAPLIVRQLFEILANINRDGLTVLLVEQYVNLALEASDRAYVLSKGRVVSTGQSKDLLADPDLMRSAYLGHVGQAESESVPGPERPDRAGASAP